MNKLLSIIIPVYNRVEHIKKCVNSCINKEYKNIEIIVVDDGSEDDIKSVIDSFKDKRIKYFYIKHSGVSKARNYGISKSKGNCIMFLDSDDYLDKYFFKNFDEVLNMNSDIVIFKNYIKTNNENINNFKLNSFSFDKSEKELLLNSIYNKFEKYGTLVDFDGPCGKIIKRDLIVKNKIKFKEDILRYEDAIFMHECYTNTDNIKYLEKDCLYYVQNSNSLCHKYNKDICNIIYRSLAYLNEMTSDKQLFYIKCITSLSDLETTYFLNKEYNKNKKERTKEYKEIISKKYFKDAIHKVKYKNIPFHYIIEIILLRHNLITLYLNLKTYHFKRKKLI